MPKNKRWKALIRDAALMRGVRYHAQLQFALGARRREELHSWVLPDLTASARMRLPPDEVAELVELEHRRNSEWAFMFEVGPSEGAVNLVEFRVRSGAEEFSEPKVLTHGLQRSTGGRVERRCRNQSPRRGVYLSGEPEKLYWELRCPDCDGVTQLLIVAPVLGRQRHLVAWLRSRSSVVSAAAGT
jgi:hypothetical protein